MLLHQVILAIHTIIHKVHFSEDCRNPGMSEVQVEVIFDPGCEGTDQDYVLIEVHLELTEKHSIVMASTVTDLSVRQ